MLSSADVKELAWWFDEPPPTYMAGRLLAQSYEPGGGVEYDPTTDTRLERMLFAAMSFSHSKWMRIYRILAELLPSHRDVLRRAYGPRPKDALSDKLFRFPEVAIVTHTALAMAVHAKRSAEQQRLIAIAKESARRDGCSLLETSERVDRIVQDLQEHHTRVEVSYVEVRRFLTREVKSGKDTVLTKVRSEMQGLVNAAGDEYRAARARIKATHRELQSAHRRARIALLDEHLGRLRRKEAARFEARLRS